MIETQNSNNFEQQIMTSSKYTDSNYENILNSLCKNLSQKYKILRRKVEIKPENIKNENFIYYESHLRLKLPKNHNYTILNELCKKSNFHLSKNLFKADEEYIYQMITYRDFKIDLNEFKLNIDTMLEKLNNEQIRYDKIEIEECIFDSNLSIDNNWLKKMIL